MAKRNKDKVLTKTHNKLMIRESELGRILNSTELQQFNDIINKIHAFDLKESQRKDGIC